LEIITFDEIVKAIGGEIVLKDKVQEYNSICTDTRKISMGNIFVAINGDNFNGNDFAEAASNSGAGMCIVDELKFDPGSIKNTSIIKVNDTRKALLDLAKYYRKKLRTKIIGITGSTGKTSTKDLTAAALSTRYKVFKTQGNFNNEIGLPLMIFSLDNSYDIAVLEMGMNNLGEIHRMAEAALPDMAIITNVGITHIENLKTKENILKAKLEIADFFNDESKLIINSDNDILKSLNNKNYKVITAGIESKSDYQAYDIKLGDDFVKFKIFEYGVKYPEEFYVNVPGSHTVNNALLAIATARNFGLDLNEINKGLEALEKTAMRLDIIKGSNCTIINDCYNANPDSMKSGLEVLKNFKCERRVAILGSMRELGTEGYNAHKMIGEYAKACGIDLLITLGEYSAAFKEGFGENCFAFDDYDEAVRFAKDFLKENDAVIVKASRSMKFEEIVEKLKEDKVADNG
jgi:UDP-N-acetylmuramoyl-tripeptide--D-alanyl-D-alanine ligase